jgi:hypothetical protein
MFIRSTLTVPITRWRNSKAFIYCTSHIILAARLFRSWLAMAMGELIAQGAELELNLL